MIEVVITHSDSKEERYLTETPNNEYGIRDLCWAFYQYDKEGYYFRHPDIALERIQKEILPRGHAESRETLAFIAACCHTHVRGWIPSSAPVKAIEPYKVGSTVRIIRGCYPPGKTARIERARWNGGAETGRGMHDLKDFKPVGDHPYYKLEGISSLYYHCELEPV